MKTLDIDPTSKRLLSYVYELDIANKIQGFRISESTHNLSDFINDDIKIEVILSALQDVEQNIENSLQVSRDNFTTFVSARGLERTIAQALNIAISQNAKPEYIIMFSRMYLLSYELSQVFNEALLLGKRVDKDPVRKTLKTILCLAQWLDKKLNNRLYPSTISILQSSTSVDKMRGFLLDELDSLANYQLIKKGHGYRFDHKQWEQNVSDIMHAYATLALLEKRRRGEPGFEPFEGLRLVRERRKDKKQ